MTAPVDRHFFKYIANAQGIQGAITTLGDGWKFKYDGIFSCSTCELDTVLSSGGPHVPQTDPYFGLYDEGTYSALLTTVLAVLKTGSKGEVTKIQSALDGSLPQTFAPFLTVVHYHNILRRNEYENGSFEENCTKVTNSFKIAMQSRHRIFPVKPEVKEFMEELVDGMVSNRFAAPFNQGTPNYGDNTSLEETLMIQPVIQLAGKACQEALLDDGETHFGPWFKLLSDPTFFKDKYLPSMPENELAAILGAIDENLGVYKCPNGHLYTIGNCTRPNQSAKCPDCGAAIGNAEGKGSHTLARGTQLVGFSKNQTYGEWAFETEEGGRLTDWKDKKILANNDDSPAGYSATETDGRGANDQVRKTRPAAYRVLRYLLHGCLALACAMGKTESVKKLCSRSVDVEFFRDLMRKDFRIFMQLSNSSAEDASMMLNLIVSEMTPLGGGECTHSNKRAQYEESFGRRVVNGIFDDMPATKRKIEQIKGASKEGASLMVLSQWVNEMNTPDPKNFPNLMRFREPLTVNRFQFALDTSPAAQQYSTLITFMETHEDLHTAGLLYTFLRMINLVAQRYGQRIPRNGAGRSATNLTFWDAIIEVPSEQADWEEAFRDYHRAWNFLAPHHVEFECARVGAPPPHNWAGMPLLDNDQHATDDWMGAAKRHSIKFAMVDIRDSDGNKGTDPDSCMAKLHVDMCINAHNEFINGARDYMAQVAALQVNPNVNPQDVVDESPALPLNMVRQMNMIKFSMDDFEAATRQYADQSLAYGKGKEVEYNFAAVQRWVLDNVAGNVPKIEAMLRMFPFAGEGQGIRDIIGGIQQEEMATELAEMIASEELNTLTLQRLALTRLEETIGFLDRMSAEDPEMIFGKYCMDALLMDEDTMLDFGSPASNVRTAIRLKHLKSLYTLLRNLLIDPIAKISEPYTVPLTEVTGCCTVHYMAARIMHHAPVHPCAPRIPCILVNQCIPRDKSKGCAKL